MRRLLAVALVCISSGISALATSAFAAEAKYNVLFIISDDLTSTALSCYGNKVCETPNIDRIAASGTRFTRAYCQGTYCGPSRASFMSGYYPHATGVLGYKNPRPQIGDRATWSQHFKNNGYYAARVSKIFHMGVPGGIEAGGDGRDHDGGNGADDAASWTERFNSPGPEWKAPGAGETLENNPFGKKPVVGGNTFVVVEADGDDLVHSDGKTAAKAVELIEKHKNEPFWLGVGFVRPHVPFVAPKPYFRFWAKVSLREESASVPLIIRVPGKKPAVCHSLVELLDHYPTISALCGLEVPNRLQGKDIGPMLDDPTFQVRDAGFSVAPARKGFLLREDKWAYIQYKEDASGGIELFDMEQDPKQYTNLAGLPEHQPVVARFKSKMATKLREIRDNDLDRG